METGREFTYLGECSCLMRAGGGCKFAVTAGTTCKHIKGMWPTFSFRLKVAVYNIYIRSEILYGSEAWCPNESVMGILYKST